MLTFLTILTHKLIFSLGEDGGNKLVEAINKIFNPLFFTAYGVSATIGGAFAIYNLVIVMSKANAGSAKRAEGLKALRIILICLIAIFTIVPIMQIIANIYAGNL